MRSWPYYGADNSGERHRPWWQWNLTRRGRIVVGTALTAGLIGAMWLASALGYWATGVKG